MRRETFLIVFLFAATLLTGACAEDSGCSSAGCSGDASAGGGADTGTDTDSESDSATGSGSPVCCLCTCFTIIDENIGEEEVREIQSTGTGISCDTACGDECNQLSWELRYAETIPCPEPQE